MQNTQSGWTLERTKKLFELAAEFTSKGKPLSGVYKTIALEAGMSEGSVRNYYYSHLHTFSLMPELSKKLGIKECRTTPRQFETFGDGEAEKLVETILTKLAKGQSVRAVIEELSGGDRKKALRLQNKYRSIVFRQRARTEKIMAGLRQRKTEYLNPYTKTLYSEDAVQNAEAASDNIVPQLENLVALLGDDAVNQLIRGITRLAFLATEAGAGYSAGPQKENLPKLNSFVHSLAGKNRKTL